MKLLSLFSGIGAFEKALGEHELVNYCEIDKYASKSYSLIHGVSEDKNLGDITKVNTSTLPTDIDLITYGFPCQDISVAGKQQGFVDNQGNRTRSGLFFDALRVIQDTKPKYAIAENVKALVGKKFKTEFNIVLDCLEKAGYNNYYKVLNAKDYGIPQNRERVFIVSIRKDIDDNSFVFPQPFELKTKLKDLLENEVDEKYYIKDVKNIKFCKNYIQYDQSSKGYNSQQYRLYYQDVLSPTIPAGSHGDKTKVILLDKNEIDGVWKLSYLDDFKVRKVTPKECWRLMGFDDEDIDKCINAGLSDAQLYKQAGNSIVVNVIKEIFKEMKL